MRRLIACIAILIAMSGTGRAQDELTSLFDLTEDPLTPETTLVVYQRCSAVFIAIRKFAQAAAEGDGVEELATFDNGGEAFLTYAEEVVAVNDLSVTASEMDAAITAAALKYIARIRLAINEDRPAIDGAVKADFDFCIGVAKRLRG